MTYIHEQPHWPVFSWNSKTLTTKLAAVRNQQGLLLGRMASLGFSLQEESSLINLTQDIVKSSAIEGEFLNPEEVRSSIARRMGLEMAGLIPSSRNIDAIVDMILDATIHYDEPLTSERLFRWQAALFPTGQSGLYKIKTGAWRSKESGPMQVISGPIGKEKIHFETPSAERLESEMDQFLAWFNNETSSQLSDSESMDSIDPVLKAGIAHLWFITLHPFEDGNGRIARAISDMALSQADQTNKRFYSLSSQIESERKNYYQQLESQQKGRLDITPWLEWFLDCLDRSITNADILLSKVLYKAKFWEQVHQETQQAGLMLNPRQVLILNKLLGDFEGYLNSSKYAKLAKCSQDTAARDIRELLELKILIQNLGKGRSTSYQLGVIY